MPAQPVPEEHTQEIGPQVLVPFEETLGNKSIKMSTEEHVKPLIKPTVKNMATIELSISSEDLYWKVMILCVMLGLMFLCEHFILNVFVKIVVTILNTVLLVNLVLSMVADAEKDNNALEKLKTINKITKQTIFQAEEQDEFILPILSREEENNDSSYCRADKNRTMRNSPGNCFVTMANGQSVECLGQGTRGILRLVYWVPRLSKNLLSVQALAKEGCYITFAQDYVYIEQGSSGTRLSSIPYKKN